MLDRLERQAFRTVRRELIRASKDMIRRYELTGEVHQARDHLSNLEAVYLDMTRASIRAMGREFDKQFKAAGIALEVKTEEDTVLNWALEYIMAELMRERIVRVADETRRRIVQGVAAGYEQGLSQIDTAEEILKRVPEMTARRAGVIARTETHAASQYAAQKQAKAAQVPMQKEWVAGDDKRVRRVPRDAFDHLAADGQTVGLDEPFQINRKSGGTEAIQFPGDPAGSAGNIINCRCVVTHQVIAPDLDGDIFAGIEL